MRPSDVLIGENDPLSLTKPSKESTSIATPRRPLGDRTNGKFKSAVASVEGSKAHALPCVQSVLGSDQEYETVRLDSEGFVIWEDEDLTPASTEISLVDQIAQLQSALTSTLEENRMVLPFCTIKSHLLAPRKAGSGRVQF